MGSRGVRARVRAWTCHSGGFLSLGGSSVIGGSGQHDIALPILSMPLGYRLCFGLISALIVAANMRTASHIVQLGAG